MVHIEVFQAVVNSVADMDYRVVVNSREDVRFWWNKQTLVILFKTEVMLFFFET